jgi:hypothetical protein
MRSRFSRAPRSAKSNSNQDLRRVNNLGSAVARLRPGSKRYRRTLTPAISTGREDTVARALNNIGLAQPQRRHDCAALIASSSLVLKEKTQPPDRHVTVNNVGVRPRGARQPGARAHLLSALALSEQSSNRRRSRHWRHRHVRPTSTPTKRLYLSARWRSTKRRRPRERKIALEHRHDDARAGRIADAHCSSGFRREAIGSAHADRLLVATAREER